MTNVEWQRNDQMANAEDAPCQCFCHSCFVIDSSFIIRTWSLSSLLNQIRELIEKIRGIMRAGRGFRMVLHAEDRQFLVAHSLHCAVIQIDVRYFHVRRK